MNNKFIGNALLELGVQNFAVDSDGTINTEESYDVSELEAKVAELETEYLAKAYQRARAKAYPSLTEQLDMQYWDSINGTTTWADAIQAVKDAYPKP